MNETELTQQLPFVVARARQDKTSILGQAVGEGIHALYRDALIEAYWLGQATPVRVPNEFGPGRLNQVADQRDALKRDVAWGMRNVN
jgi:hypothetical protein